MAPVLGRGPSALNRRLKRPYELPRSPRMRSRGGHTPRAMDPSLGDSVRPSLGQSCANENRVVDHRLRNLDENLLPPASIGNESLTSLSDLVGRAKSIAIRSSRKKRGLQQFGAIMRRRRRAGRWQLYRALELTNEKCHN